MILGFLYDVFRVMKFFFGLGAFCALLGIGLVLLWFALRLVVGYALLYKHVDLLKHDRLSVPLGVASARMAEAASIVAAIPAVRTALVDIQRGFAIQAPAAPDHPRDQDEPGLASWSRA